MKAFLVPVICVAFFGTAQAMLSDRALRAQAPDVELPLTRTEKWNPKLFEWLSFGQTQAVADYMLIRFLVEDPAIQHVSPGTHPPAYFHLDLATELDPGFFELYPVGSNYLSVIRDDIQGAVELLHKGKNYYTDRLPGMPQKMEQFWSRRWHIAMLLAYNYLYELHDLPKASQFFIESSHQPGAPRYLERLERKLQHPGGLYEVGIQMTEFQLQGASDQDVEGALVQELKRRLQALQLQYFLWKLNQQWDLAKASQKKDLSAWLSKQGFSQVDPVGGRLVVENGKITTTTVFERALGLE